MKFYKKVYLATIIVGVIVASILKSITPELELTDIFNTIMICYGFYHLLEWKYGETNGE